MPKRDDLSSIAIIGAGPIVIGQACEFDYSGAQACKALREEGYRVVLINSNPATIMTDPELADATYVEPLTHDMLVRILEAERPDAVLPTMGGQTALNLALALEDSGTLKRLGIQLIGADKAAIHKAEDRLEFRKAMDKIGLESPRSCLVNSEDQAQEALREIGLPAILRPSFTLGGAGGGIAEGPESFRDMVRTALAASPVGEVLIEESVLGWKEYEMEVVRDRADNAIIICSIENIDPMGVHTGDSITVAPALTLTDKEYQNMRDASLAVLREIGVETGGSNVQFAVNPKTGRLVVIEANPRVSRSSALASKATGFPIARIAAKLAVGYTLDELRNEITGVTPASFEPSIDYIVTKIPRFTFEKFGNADATLTTSMKSVGEAMAIGVSFRESLGKALRSLEVGLRGLESADLDEKTDLKAAIRIPSPHRILAVADGFRAGMSVDLIYDLCKIDRWFLREIKEIVSLQKRVSEDGLPKTAIAWRDIKANGLSDAQIAKLTGESVEDVQTARHAAGVHPIFRRIDTCAAEFSSQTAYMYSSYHTGLGSEPACEAEPTSRRKVMILGGGPNRIGQGVEFDYCCVHAAYALREAGYETIMVNCNPETVSTDYDTSDRLYFEPLTAEDVIEIARREQDNGSLEGIIVQFGGQTPLSICSRLESAGLPILGTSPSAIDLAEDREQFQQLLHKFGLRQPENGIARSAEEAESVAQDIGFPLILRPSYVLGGRAMEIVEDMEGLRRYITESVRVSGTSPVLLDKFLSDAIEIDVDAISDGNDVFVAGIMEHVEEAGIHSGDSACFLPGPNLSAEIREELKRQTHELAIALKVCGLMNIQFAVKEETVYVLEVNPRASRTAPFVAKATGNQIARIAARVMVGERLADIPLKPSHPVNWTAVKEAVFPFNRFPGEDVLLGPEMKSTGEVMGIDSDPHLAFAKAQFGAGLNLPQAGLVFISVKDEDKKRMIEGARTLDALGYSLCATSGTVNIFREAGIVVQLVHKVSDGADDHAVAAILDGRICLVINTVYGAESISDSKSIRQACLSSNVPLFTTVRGGLMAVSALKKLHEREWMSSITATPLQRYNYE